MEHISYIFLGQSLTERQFIAFLVLVNGGVLISVKHTRFYQLGLVWGRFKEIFGNALGGIHAKYRPTRRLLVNSVISALFFASYYVLIKYIYSSQPFIGGFVWSRLGGFLAALAILLVPSWRKLIIKNRKQAEEGHNFFLFIAVRLLAALAFILLNWAISLGSVALTNSLQGVQYIFLIFIVLFLSSRHPHVLKEELGGGMMLQKIIGTCLIFIGLYMLA